MCRRFKSGLILMCQSPIVVPSELIALFFLHQNVCVNRRRAARGDILSSCDFSCWHLFFIFREFSVGGSSNHTTFSTSAAICATGDCVGNRNRDMGQECVIVRSSPWGGNVHPPGTAYWPVAPKSREKLHCPDEKQQGSCPALPTRKAAWELHCPD